MSTLSTCTSGLRPLAPSLGDTLFETDTKRIITCSNASPVTWRKYSSDGVAYSSGGASELQYPSGLWSSSSAPYYLSVDPEMHFDATIMDGLNSSGNPADGAAVALWVDRSGNLTNYDALQATSSQQPTWNAIGPGGAASISWAVDTLALPVATQFTPSGSYTQITVSVSNNATKSSVIGDAINWQNTPWLKFSANLYDYVNGGGRGDFSTTTSLEMHTVRRDGTSVYFYEGGGTSLGNWTSATVMHYDQIGTVGLGGAHDGDISEILVFPSALSVAHLNVVRLYLANKYGLTTAAFT